MASWSKSCLSLHPHTPRSLPSFNLQPPSPLMCSVLSCPSFYLQYPFPAPLPEGAKESLKPAPVAILSLVTTPYSLPAKCPRNPPFLLRPTMAVIHIQHCSISSQPVPYSSFLLPQPVPGSLPPAPCSCHLAAPVSTTLFTSHFLLLGFSNAKTGTSVDTHWTHTWNTQKNCRVGNTSGATRVPSSPLCIMFSVTLHKAPQQRQRLDANGVSSGQLQKHPLVLVFPPS